MRMPDQREESRGGTLATGLDLLEALVEQPAGMGVTDLAALVGIDKGNAHRLLRLLQARGYVAQETASRRYTATPQVLTLAGSVLRRLDTRSVAEPVCDELLQATQESVHAAVVTRDGVVYVLHRRGPSAVSVETEVGSRPPLHATATGKAVLAHLAAAHVRELVAEPLAAFTFRTHRTFESLTAELQRIRADGYAIDDEEYNLGVRCVACPVFGMDGAVVGSIGISGPVQRVTTERLSKITELVKSGAARVTTGLGGADASSTQGALRPVPVALAPSGG
jgi:DNA-binding IclR family transcriptional regulator